MTVPREQPRQVAGLLLAAGGGRRMGRPKALVADPGGGTFLERGLRVLRESGCGPVVVVLGAGVEEARPLATAGTAPADVVVEATDWADGQSASLRAGLRACLDTDAEAALVLLVDLPDVGPPVVVRLLAETAGEGPAVLARAAYAGVPGHPVLLGRDHWDEVLTSATGDKGARDHLARHPHLVVECGDLATGLDADTPADLV
ncbi:NTP transferase domain-containing protein [Phycicoccus sp. Root563]|uniref:nucleotidyltransferase family protein n=1 Tax=Phycicoccus sp. Root563 TaxID=1736562 RepID=UPI000A667721|nr:nucleotidyltransferase family protein [Phycicoccus sp. Root563]